MNTSMIHTAKQMSQTLPAPSPATYGDQLAKAGFEYETSDYYYHIGEPVSVQGWLLHLSVIPMQMPALLETVLPIIKQLGVPFSVIREKDLHYKMDSGSLGRPLVGKAITLYPEGDEQTLDTARLLLDHTTDFKGPFVLSALPLGGIVYTRYGGFRPLVGTDIYGNKEQFIYNPSGEPVKDIYYFPARVPQGILNPFLPIIEAMPKPTNNKTLAGKLFPLNILKKDDRGDVFKAIYIRHLRPVKCVVKEGNPHSLSDDYGRDIGDRFRWQSEVQERLRDFADLPKVYEIFEDAGRVYLVMRFIPKARDLNIRIYELLHNKPWFSVENKKKKKVIDLALQVLHFVSAMHAHGLLHRDITGTNFLVGKSGKIYPIDVELAYDMKSGEPDPAFGIGTPGFMTQEQFEGQLPTVKDDVYAFGALLILMVTGIEPRRIIEHNLRNVRRKLFFLTDSETLTNTILACLHHVPAVRPELSTVGSALEMYGSSLQGTQKPVKGTSLPDRSEIVETVDKGLRSLSLPTLLHSENWVSESTGNFNLDINPLGQKAIYAGIHRGALGVLFLLSKARQVGLEVPPTAPEAAGWELAKATFGQGSSDSAPGLYFGSAGLAAVMATAVKSGALQPEATTIAEVTLCLGREAPLLDIIYGTAGQGMALLSCRELLGDTIVERIGSGYAGRLIATQEPDGSWMKPGGDEKIVGFGYGIAGIVYFLLEYAHAFGHGPSMEAALKGLHYLSGKAQKVKGHYWWANSNLNKATGSWWCHGNTGIALTFMKAYEITREKAYKSMAEQSADVFSEDFIYYNLSQCHGMSGLGEIYLEAYRIFEDDRWLHRAGKIASTLNCLKIQESTDHLYWLTESPEFPTADFMTGSSGVLHFLLRYLYPNRLTYPLL